MYYQHTAWGLPLNKTSPIQEAISVRHDAMTDVRWFIGDFTLTAQYFASKLRSVDGDTDGRDSLLTNSMNNIVK